MQDNIWRDWLKRRHITDTTLDDFGVYWGPSPMGESIVIPVRDELGTFVFNKYRRNPLSDDKPKYMYDRGSRMMLYGWHLAKDQEKIFITEGELDALVMWSKNCPAVSSTGGALSFPEEWGERFKGKEVIVCFDNDMAGGEGMVKVLEVVPHAKLLFLPDRPGIKDISDYVQHGGDIGALKPVKFQSLEEIVADRSERAAMWRSTFFHDAYIKKHQERPSRKVAFLKDGNAVEQAKEYPIDELIEFRQHKARCLWHNEKTASLHYYEKTNKCYCFGGCGKTYDAIDVYMKLHGVDFKKAVEELNKKI